MPPQIFSRPECAVLTSQPLFVISASIWPDCSARRNRQRILFRSLLTIIAVAFFFPLFTGCRKKVSVPAAAPATSTAKPRVNPVSPAATPATPTTPAAEPVKPTVPPNVIAAPGSLDLGEASFRARNYVKAIRSFEDYLQKNPESSNRDMVLFRLGLSLALADSPARNMRKSEYNLKRLVSECPESPYRGPAEFILDLQSQVENLKEDLKEKEAKIKLLSEELQKLKEIDLQRRPSRP